MHDAYGSQNTPISSSPADSFVVVAAQGGVFAAFAARLFALQGKFAWKFFRTAVFHDRYVLYYNSSSIHLC